MNPVSYKFSLDMHKSGSQYTVKGVRAGDTRSRELYISLTESGRPYQLPNAECCEAIFYGIKPDGTAVMNLCNIEESRIVYMITSQTIAAVGVVDCQIAITGTNDSGDVVVLAAPQFSIEVDENIETSDAVTSTNEMTVLQSIISAIDNMGVGVITATYLDGDEINLETILTAGLYVIRGTLKNYAMSPFGNDGKTFTLLVTATYDDTAFDEVNHNCTQIAFGEGIRRRRLSVTEGEMPVSVLTPWQDMGDFEVLDKLSAPDGTLLYDGNPIGGGELTQATETTLGGIKAKAKTTESNEVAIDTETGRLFAPSVPVEISGGFIPLVDTLPETASNGDMAYVKAAYDELTPIPSSEFANEAGYFHLDFAEGWDTAELSPANFNECGIHSSTSSQLIHIQLVDAATTYNSLGADTVAIVVIEESVIYIYPISDVPSLGFEARKWYETNTEFNLFTEAETPDISIPNPYYTDSGFVVADYTEFDKVFTFSRVKKHLSGLYRYKGGWVRIFSDSVTDIDLLTQLVNDFNSDRLFLDSNAMYNLNTTNSQLNIYVIMPENVNDEIDNSILLNFYCDVDKNLIFDENVNIAEIDTTAGYHELIMTYNKSEGKWWVRQTAEEWA